MSISATSQPGADLGPAQQRALVVFVSWWARMGVAPTCSELAARLGVSESRASNLCRALARRQLLVPNGKPRRRWVPCEVLQVAGKEAIAEVRNDG